MRHRHFGWAPLALLILGARPAQAAFLCPAADVPRSERGVDMHAVPPPGGEPGITPPVREAVGRMRSEGLRGGMIVDRLVAAYCSSLADGGGSDQEKAGKVSRFASTLAHFVYTPSSGQAEEVVIDVPVPTPLFDRVMRAAKAAHQSRDEWMRQAIQSRLGSP